MGSRYDLWFTRLTGAVTFALGAGTFVYETIAGHNLEFAALAIGIMGAPLGKAVENVLIWVASLRPSSSAPQEHEKP